MAHTRTNTAPKTRTVVPIFLKEGRVLMEQRTLRRNVYAGYLMYPGGHIEEGESFEQALLREMREEFGITVVKASYMFSIDDVDPFSGKEFEHNILLVESFEGELRIRDKEAEELRWLTYEDVVRAHVIPIVQKAAVRLHEEGLF